MTCSKTTQIHRYHDGELSPTERVSIETHLQECAECGRLLSDLRRLSSLISGASRVDVPAEVLGHLYESWPTARDRGILRLAGWMTAAAASLLIGALLMRYPDRTETASLPSIWESVAVMSPLQVQDDADSDLTVMAQWMADDLSSEGQW